MGVLIGQNVGSSISVTATYGGKSGSVTGISVSKVDPVLFFDNDFNDDNFSVNQTYDGTQKCLGYIAYTGDGTVYYQVIKATSQPSTPSASASGWVSINGGDYIYGSASGVATDAGTYYVFLKTTGSVNYNDVSPMAAGSTTIAQATGTKPTFNNSSVSANLAPTAATTSPAVNCGTFTAATAGHSGSITYSIVSVNGGAVGSWSMTSTTSRVIKVPASTAGGTYTIVVRATEAATTNYTSSYKDATITVTVNKASQDPPTATGATTTYATSGSITGSASGGGGVGSLYYRSDTAGGTSYGTATTTAPSRNRNSVGTTTFIAYWAGNNYWAQSSNSGQASLVVNLASQPMTISPTSKTIYSITSNGTGNPSGYTYHTFTITASNAQGTVTASSSNTSVATVSVSGNTITVTYKGAGTATITVNAAGNTNYAAGSKTCAVTCTLDTVSNSNYNPSGYIASASIGTSPGLTAAGGSVTVTATASHQANNLYVSGYVDTTTHTVTDTATWSITSQTFTPKPSGSASTITRFSKSGNTLSHSTMGTNIGVDSVTVTAVNSSSSSATGTAPATIDNKRTWGNPTVSHTTPVSLAVAGQTYTMSPTISQTATYTSGSSESNTTGTYTYAVTTSKTGYSLSSNQVTVTNNTSTSARNGFVVTITGTGKTGTDSTYDSGYGKTGTKAVTFNQAAGAQVYANPTVLTYTYADFAASGETKTPTVTYSQSWTWNGVAGSGGTITTGGSLEFDTTAILPSGFSIGSNYTTTGSVTWANRTTVPGDIRDAAECLSVVVTLNGKSSTPEFICSSCKQVANNLTGLTMTVGSNPIAYNSKTSVVVSATYTSGSSKDVSSTATYDDTSTPDIVEFNKTETL